MLFILVEPHYSAGMDFNEKDSTTGVHGVLGKSYIFETAILMVINEHILESLNELCFEVWWGRKRMHQYSFIERRLKGHHCFHRILYLTILFESVACPL